MLLIQTAVATGWRHRLLRGACLHQPTRPADFCGPGVTGFPYLHSAGLHPIMQLVTRIRCVVTLACCCLRVWACSPLSSASIMYVVQPHHCTCQANLIYHVYKAVCMHSLVYVGLEAEERQPAAVAATAFPPQEAGGVGHPGGHEHWLPTSGHCSHSCTTACHQSANTVQPVPHVSLGNPSGQAPIVSRVGNSQVRTCNKSHRYCTCCC